MTGAEPPRVPDNRRVEIINQYRVPSRNCQAGFSVHLSLRVVGERHPKTDMERLAAERRACAHRDQNAENERAALPAYLRRSVEVAAETRRSERRRYNLSVDARGYCKRHLATLGEDCENHQTYLFPCRAAHSRDDDADFRRRFIYGQ